ncbi:hypothetical protein GGR57DRAFT_426277 [Xylariaceae sp. FL1272]|nr:hypothetical protein GGR57DRAFT_426277 [Xylariaceae sp. FL1272]
MASSSENVDTGKTAGPIYRVVENPSGKLDSAKPTIHDPDPVTVRAIAGVGYIESWEEKLQVVDFVIFTKPQATQPEPTTRRGRLASKIRAPFHEVHTMLKDLRLVREVRRHEKLARTDPDYSWYLQTMCTTTWDRGVYHTETVQLPGEYHDHWAPGPLHRHTSYIKRLPGHL